MKKFWIIISVCWLWTCGGSPTEPDIELPTVQNIEFTLEEDTSKTFTFMGSDPLNRALTYSVSTQPQHGTLTINAGAGTYAPNANYHGADTFAYIATNVDGSSNIGTIVATITPLDDEPNSMDVTATTDEDNAIEITLQAEEVDGDNIEFQVRNNPSNGSVSISGTTATYTPNSNWNGTDTFNFEAVDSNAKSVLNVATATITVNPVNDAPTVENYGSSEGPHELFINKSLNFEFAGNDYDEDSLTYEIVDNPENGTVSLSGNTATYNASNISGSDNFTYRAYDGTVYSNTATVFINVITASVFGDDNYDYFYSIVEDNNGDYLIAGTSNSFTDGTAYLVKANTDGQEVWYNTYGANHTQDIIEMIKITSDGGFILVGSSNSTNGKEFSVIKTDSSGNEEWSKTNYSTRHNHEENALDVIETLNNDFIFVGFSTDDGNGEPAGHIFRIDSQGNVLWSKETENVIWNIEKLDNDNYIIGGLDLIKIDSQGNEIWKKGNFNFGNGWGAMTALQVTSDNGFILGAGNTIIKVDSSGDEVWSQTYDFDNGGSSENIRDIKQTSDGGFIIGGYVHIESAGRRNDFLLHKIDLIGNTEWTKLFGGEADDEAHSVIETSNGDFVIAGFTNSFSPPNQTNGYLVKTDSQGNQEW